MPSNKGETINYSAIKRQKMAAGKKKDKSFSDSMNVTVKGIDLYVEYYSKNGTDGNLLAPQGESYPEPDSIELLAVTGDVLAVLDLNITRSDIEEAIKQENN